MDNQAAWRWVKYNVFNINWLWLFMLWRSLLKQPGECGYCGVSPQNTRSVLSKIRATYCHSPLGLMHNCRTMGREGHPGILRCSSFVRMSKLTSHRLSTIIASSFLSLKRLMVR